MPATNLSASSSGAVADVRPGRHAWTKDDDALLRVLVRRRRGVAIMADLLGRTEMAVYHRIHRKRLVTRWDKRKRSGMTDEEFKMNRRRIGLLPRC